MGFVFAFMLTALCLAIASISAPPPSYLQAAEAYSRGTSGDAMLVMHEGKVIYEAGAVSQRHMLASGSKSFLGIAAAAAVQDGYLRLTDPVSDAITDWKSDPVKRSITYLQLLSMTSGIDSGSIGIEGRWTWAQIAARPMKGKPDAQFEYGPTHINAGAYAIELKLKNETYEAYLKRRILDPLGITLEWRGRCRDGHPQAAGGGQMTARDWATFGEFVRLGGKWKGKQLVDPSALAQCFKGTKANPAYGLTWWLGAKVTADDLRNNRMLNRVWGDLVKASWLPHDLVAACGAGNQRLYVIAAHGLVVVRLASMDRSFSDADFVSLVLRGKKASAP